MDFFGEFRPYLYGYGSDEEDGYSLASEDPEDADRVFLLAPVLSRFIPQEHDLVLGPQNTYQLRPDYANPPKPQTPDELRFHYCHDCEATWLVGNSAGIDAAESHPSHHTHYHDYTGQSSRAMTVYVDGACPGNGNSPERSAVGVYFGPNSSHNISRRLNVPRHTNQVAEISAAITALRHVREIMRPQREVMVRATTRPFATVESMRQVWRLTLIMATDSSYLVEGYCKHRTGWTLNPETQVWTNKRGEVMKNGALFAELHEEIDLISRVGVQVVLYHVPREFNRSADALANAALA